MPRFVVLEQGPRETAARMTVQAATTEEARRRAEAVGWKVESVTVEGDVSGPASAEQLRAKLAVIEQQIAEIANKPGLNLSFWKVFWAVLAAAAVAVGAMLLIPRN